MTAALGLALDATLRVAAIQKQADTSEIWNAIQTSGAIGTSAVDFGIDLAERVFLSSISTDLPNDAEIQMAATELAETVRSLGGKSYDVEAAAVVLALLAFIARLAERRELTPTVSGVAH